MKCLFIINALDELEPLAKAESELRIAEALYYIPLMGACALALLALLLHHRPWRGPQR